MTAILGNLANGATAIINVVVTVTAGPRALLSDPATVNATTQDLNSNNKSATQETTVRITKNDR